MVCVGPLLVVCYPGYFDIFECFPSFAVLVCRVYFSWWDGILKTSPFQLIIETVEDPAREIPLQRGSSDSPNSHWSSDQ